MIDTAYIVSLVTKLLRSKIGAGAISGDVTIWLFAMLRVTSYQVQMTLLSMLAIVGMTSHYDIASNL